MDKLKLLNNWVEQYKILDESWDTLHQLLGTDLERPLGKATFVMFDSYTEVLAAAIGANVEDLAWFIYENACGTKEMTAKNPNWKRAKKIKNTKDLLKMIEDV